MDESSIYPASGDVAPRGALARLLRECADALGIRSAEDLGDGMLRVDTETLAQRLTELSEALGGRPISKPALALWVQVLKVYPIEDVVDSLTYWACHKTKFPAPAEIASLCAEKLSYRIEKKQREDSLASQKGMEKIVRDPRAREHFDRLKSILAGSKERRDERVAIQAESNATRGFSGDF